MVFGRMPLAISARCAHARSKGRIKDNCQFVCGEEPDGLSIKTLDRQSFLVLNGVQTMSHTCQLLLNELKELQEAGVNAFRLSPQDCDMARIAVIFQETLSGSMEPEEAAALIGHTYPTANFSNGFHHAREGAAGYRGRKTKPTRPDARGDTSTSCLRKRNDRTCVPHHSRHHSDNR